MVEKLDNYFVDGKWVGRFRVGDKVTFTSDLWGKTWNPVEATVTTCFGWGKTFGYAYIVTFYNASGEKAGFAHAQEYQLLMRLSEIPE